ncbi:MAG: MFS transporter, partial [Spirochaetes bacterium]
MNNESHYRVYPYRWIVLGVFMFTNLAIQILWISYAPITGLAAVFYGVTDLQIGLLSMSFMIAFIPLSIPSSWAIDTIGFRKSVRIGAVMMAVFGVLRGFAGGNYTFVLITTFGLAASQPLLLNSWTTVSAKWFPENQRATAVGLVTLANLVGTAIGMVVTPILVESGTAISRIQLVYGIIAAASAVLFLIFAREKPKSAPSALAIQTRALMVEGLQHAFASKP